MLHDSAYRFVASGTSRVASGSLAHAASLPASLNGPLSLQAPQDFHDLRCPVCIDVQLVIIAGRIGIRVAVRAASLRSLPIGLGNEGSVLGTYKGGDLSNLAGAPAPSLCDFARHS
jgi:hypothetical protein